MPAPGTIRTSNSQCSFVTSKLGGRELGSVMMMMHWHVDDGITADALLSWTQTDWNGDGRSVLWVGGRALGGLAKALRPEVSQGVDEDGPRDPRAVHRLPLDVCAPFSPVLIASQAEALSILKSALLSSALFDLCPPLCICEHVHRDILACYLYQVPPLSGEYQDLRLQVRPFDVAISVRYRFQLNHSRHRRSAVRPVHVVCMHKHTRTHARARAHTHTFNPAWSTVTPPHHCTAASINQHVTGSLSRFLALPSLAVIEGRSFPNQ
eukprot:521206-Rhodomonas_salina.2